MSIRSVSSAASVASTPVSPVVEEAMPAPKIEKNSDKASYSIGFDTGIKIGKEFGDIIVPMFEKGFSDAITGQSPALLPNEIAFIIENLKKQLEVQTAANMLVKIKEQNEFFKTNASKPDVHNLEGILYKINKTGTGDNPSVESRVLMHSRLTPLLNEELVIQDTFEKNAPQTIQVKKQMPGLVKALKQMKAGDKWTVYLPSDQAFGEAGNALIEPNTALTCVVELLFIVQK